MVSGFAPSYHQVPLLSYSDSRLTVPSNTTVLALFPDVAISPVRIRTSRLIVPDLLADYRLSRPKYPCGRNPVHPTMSFSAVDIFLIRGWYRISEFSYNQNSKSNFLSHYRLQFELFGFSFSRQTLQTLGMCFMPLLRDGRSGCRSSHSPKIWLSLFTSFGTPKPLPVMRSENIQLSLTSLWLGKNSQPYRSSLLSQMTMYRKVELSWFNATWHDVRGIGNSYHLS